MYMYFLPIAITVELNDRLPRRGSLICRDKFMAMEESAGIVVGATSSDGDF